MRIETGPIPYWRGIPSRGRPDNLKLVDHENPFRAVGPSTWYVYPEERAAYEDAAVKYGVEHLVDIKPRYNPGLSNGRNQIIEDAFERDLPCGMMDDDFSNSRFVVNYKTSAMEGAPKLLRKITVDESFNVMLRRGLKFPFPLVSSRVDSQPLGFTRCVSSHRSIIGQDFIVFPSEIRFNPEFPHNEDFDFWFQHLVKYGGATVNLDVNFECVHWGNDGGVVDLRTEKMDEEVRRLMSRWSRYCEPKEGPFKYRFHYGVIQRELIDKENAADYYRFAIDADVHWALTELAGDTPEVLSVPELIVKIMEEENL